MATLLEQPFRGIRTIVRIRWHWSELLVPVITFLSSRVAALTRHNPILRRRILIPGLQMINGPHPPGLSVSIPPGEPAAPTALVPVTQPDRAGTLRVPIVVLALLLPLLLRLQNHVEEVLFLHKLQYTAGARAQHVALVVLEIFLDLLLKENPAMQGRGFQRLIPGPSQAPGRADLYDVVHIVGG
ncbi:hypothetical protein [Arthrobacter sp. JCM 19049]|uniref:hypothetical protein n=1 Tax=Arthrobacter sp. JCM 19049 TaxID=1460643 RepID=UPI00243732CB|nr:hypothetical protein [Arthrobacter sp. JCM 19049]